MWVSLEIAKSKNTPTTGSYLPNPKPPPPPPSPANLARMTDAQNTSPRGSLAAAISFMAWGILPVFWKALGEVPALETTAHRVVWLLITLVPILLYRGSLGKFFHALRQPKTLAIHAFAACCIVGNWIIYIWAATHDQVIEAALGYYLTPFCYIAIGRYYYREKHTRLQSCAIAIAALGVLLLLFKASHFPWVALCLAASFTGYGLARKNSALGSLSGLALESALIMPLALGYLVFLQSQGVAHFGQNPGLTTLLCCTGLVTAVPLLLFGYGMQRIALSLLGIVQFINPTMQFLLGWLLYSEPLPLLRLISFILIWIAVLTYIFSLRKNKT